MAMLRRDESALEQKVVVRLDVMALASF